jgi:hypothetical protein
VKKFPPETSTLPEEPLGLPPLDNATSPDCTEDSPDEIVTNPDIAASGEEPNDTTPLIPIAPLLPPL